MDLRNNKVKRKSCRHISYWPFLTMIREGHQEYAKKKKKWNFPSIYLYILALVIAFKFWVLVWCKITSLLKISGFCLHCIYSFVIVIPIFPALQ